MSRKIVDASASFTSSFWIVMSLPLYFSNTYNDTNDQQVSELKAVLHVDHSLANDTHPKPGCFISHSF